jgi:hypothetical protein
MLMNKILMASMFAVVAIGALGAMGIITNLPTVNAKVLCNTSDGNCPPPGQSEIGNVG